ncbi:anhydro-N-acetylmuramic acid kinase [Magnetospirillum sp. 64-120]|uniref:anhydro-N-acetylmuramic acid kinase n=1 Tax=Magnetospirillum sp. 64-120 TaxID=1895778 RepID=UPI0009279FEE|nr:anhydro-N-acetylmuramic acid kinase [Magnetospirillum sp. 64-120]OJX80859.1 MAG: anhydro-N-acetylmuramic acid kinase [Magnetospirillum sp. 64-120]
MHKLALGLMSGTSLDGIDAALLQTDGETVRAFGPALTQPYDESLRGALRSILGGNGPVAEVERRLTEAHAQTVEKLLKRAGISPDVVDVIGFHGHTILHRPEQRRTWQIGDGAALAKLTGITVVNDFRSADVAAGGQGAPLVPVFHAALAQGQETPLAVLNIGGVGNVTWIGADGALQAFDTGPGNALIDDWAFRHCSRPLDLDGELAASGRVDLDTLKQFSHHPYFAALPPKSLDRDDFRAYAEALVGHMGAADGAATLTAFTARAVALARAHFPQPAKRWLVCGGGRHNPVLMASLEAELAVPVINVDELGWNGDALEAQAFAFLAVRTLRGLPLTFPGTTGVAHPLCGGRVTLC